MRTLCFAAAVAISSCAYQTWSVPQPMIRTRDVSSLFLRMRIGVQNQCGGIESESPEALLVTGQWQTWPLKEGAIVTRCIASQLPDDEPFATVRLTFVARYCPNGAPADLASSAHPCEEAELIPQSVKDSLDALTRAFEADVRR